MPSKQVDLLIHAVNDLKVTISALKTEVDGIKKLVFMVLGAGFTAAAGIMVQLVVAMVK